jgi:hypothetical protein
LLQVSELVPASRHETQLFTGKPAAAQLSRLMLPTHFEPPFGSGRQHPVQVSGSHWQTSSGPPSPRQRSFLPHSRAAPHAQ